jgi:hypothetical protein
MKTIRMLIENRRAGKMLVFIEPEAMDYWLDANEQCELVSESGSADGQFDLWQNDEGITVFPEKGAGYIEVHQDGTVLECGHKRPEDW